MNDNRFLVENSSKDLAEKIVTEACNVSSQDVESGMTGELNSTSRPLGQQSNVSGSCALFSAEIGASDPKLVSWSVILTCGCIVFGILFP